MSRQPSAAGAEDVDVVLVGGGVMSATLGVLLAELEPDWRIVVLERLGQAGQESSAAWHNAGTGHAGLCEFNYTPRDPDGRVDVSNAVRIGQQFLASLHFWAHLARQGEIGPAESFVRPVPHLGFGHGTDGVAYLRARWAALREHPLFADLEFSDDPTVLVAWSKLMFADRPAGEPVALTRSPQGTDVDFGELARQLLSVLVGRGGRVFLHHEATRLRRHGAGWLVEARDHTAGRFRRLRAPFVFLGAGGGTLPLLQSARVPEVRRLAVFPISGRFLRTAAPELVAGHPAKAYGHAGPGAPPLSVPHLDRRVVDGREYLLFGPFAAFSPRFLRCGRRTDLLRSIRPANLPVLLAAARDNRSLIGYLLKQLVQTRRDRLASLDQFVPGSRAADWDMITAGQRVQLLEITGGRGAMVGFGTRIVTSAGGSLAALLGASPGASTAAATMADVLRSSFPGRMTAWGPRLERLVPSAERLERLSPSQLAATVARARATLGLPPVLDTGGSVTAKAKAGNHEH